MPAEVISCRNSWPRGRVTGPSATTTKGPVAPHKEARPDQKCLVKTRAFAIAVAGAWDGQPVRFVRVPTSTVCDHRTPWLGLPRLGCPSRCVPRPSRDTAMEGRALSIPRCCVRARQRGPANRGSSPPSRGATSPSQEAAARSPPGTAPRWIMLDRPTLTAPSQTAACGQGPAARSTVARSCSLSGVVPASFDHRPAGITPAPGFFWPRPRRRPALAAL